ncbi:hypothetical protein AB3K78_09110 [Leucobacter sp. HNU]|uniref:hypothetical protein n=1 Tax=Leucobacter sp. HNU TaxID=3236805 RepID=UPI003A808839
MIELNDAQIKVLEWIRADCPDGVYPDDNYTHRVSARALHSRGLVRVSGHGKNWKAELTERGRVWPAAVPQDATEREDKARTVAAREVQASAKPALPNSKPRKAPSKPSAATLAARDVAEAEQLITRVLAAKDQQVPVEELDLGPRKLPRIIGASLKASNRPFGRKLTTHRVGNYWNGEEVVSFDFYFRDFVAEQPIPVPERVARYHPAVKEFLADKDWQYVTKEHVPRAARILQAIISEAQRRGYTVIPHSKKPKSDYRTANSVEHGNLWIETEYGLYGVEIKEVAGSGGSKFSDLGLTWDQQQRRFPIWVRRRNREFVSTGRLQLGQGTSLSSYGETHLRDARGTLLEEKLPEVFVRFDTWMLEQAEHERLKVLAKERRQRNWEAAMANAKVDYYAAERWKYFVALAEQDERLRTYRDFLARAGTAAESLPSEQRFTANGFLSEIEASMKLLDPLASPELLVPDIQKPKSEDLKPYLGGWSPYGPDER